MNPLIRTIHEVLETDITRFDSLFAKSQGKKAFQLVKYVTGKDKSTANDYSVVNTPNWYGYDTITIKGKKGFIRLALTPLFEVKE